MPKELPKKNIVSFSGGKDSTALILWAKKNLPDFETVWMDTGWEHPLTYVYVDYIDAELLDGSLIRLKSSEYEGFEDLAIQKGRVPSTKARFCTQKLKLEPIIEYFDTLRDDFEIHNYVGIRAEESYNRSKMSKREFDLDYFGCWIHRPLLKWSADDVFNTLKEHDIEPNPLYKMGMKRVGCMPCIMSNHRDMKQIIANFPEVIDSVRKLEEKLDRSFFPPNYIPDRYCSRSVVYEVEEEYYKDGSGRIFADDYEYADGIDPDEIETRIVEKRKWYPMIDDVVEYIQDNPDQLEIFDRESKSCMSHYAICE